ncbi:cell division protein [Extibacter sp. GGCC_0201]|uniref:cell division protein n=1 Tax=Extibacter sp. GGCC_0201 TaxID=2731209 RepID=UPI001AA1AD7E|nr:cell division protein [Extibacter sp. GGCC_0201]MBO1720719.1 cell division protein [Extibacter sp. GGCC_0201]
MIQIGPQDYGLAPEELVLWSRLAFQMLTCQELADAYTDGLHVQGITSGASFDYFLRRLLNRQLIVTGSGLTGVNALYNLLSGLYMQPVKDSFVLRLFSCIQLHTSGKLTVFGFQKHLKRPQNTQIEALVLKLTKECAFSVAELLSYLELAETKDIPAKKAKKFFYETGHETCDSLAQQVQLNQTQLPVLQAIGNLYLNKQIFFDK